MGLNTCGYFLLSILHLSLNKVKLLNELMEICQNIRLLLIYSRLCGHKNKDAKLDERPFGFPFDRNIRFILQNKDRWSNIKQRKLTKH